MSCCSRTTKCVATIFLLIALPTAVQLRAQEGHGRGGQAQLAQAELEGLPVPPPTPAADNSVIHNPIIEYPIAYTVEQTVETRGVFTRLPLVWKTDAAENVSDFHSTSEADILTFKPGNTVFEYFEKPAHFPLPGYAFLGQRRDSEGALIYEGMRFAMDATGRYRVHFVVGTPAMPVTLRLQFVLADASGSNHRTVTLPPISIPRKQEPKFTAEQARIAPVYASVQRVYHEGYLAPKVTRNGVSTTLTKVVSRKGTARFGYGVDVP